MESFSITIDVEPDLHSLKYTFLDEIPKFLDLLRKYNIKATFFITCDCISKNPNLFKRINNEGHEIALHGLKHVRIDGKSDIEKDKYIKEALTCFKKNIDISPKGFRAVQHSIDSSTLKLLKKNGLVYDSSLIPWNFYHLLFFWKIKMKVMNHFKRMKPHFYNGIFEIPVTSFILPFSAISLRVLPKPLLRIYFFLVSMFKNPVFIMHSWDLIEIPQSKIYKLCPQKKFMENIEFMFNYLSKKGKSKTLVNLSN